MERSVSRYLKDSAGAHRLDARLKITMLAVYSVGIFFVDSWIGMAAYLLVLLGCALTFRAPAAKVLALGIPVYVIAGLTILFNSIIPGPSGLEPSLNGLVRGCFFASRIVLLVWFSLIACFTIDPIELTHSVSSMLSPLRRLRVPVDDIATVFTIAIRFIPQIAEEYFQVRDAQWSRGAEFNEGPIASRVRAHCVIMVPVLVGLFRRADKLATSMDARCYGMRGIVRTDLRAVSPTAGSILLTALVCLLCATVSVLL